MKKTLQEFHLQNLRKFKIFLFYHVMSINYLVEVLVLHSQKKKISKVEQQI